MIEVSLSGQAGYIEGWWVDESVRRRGVGRRLLEAAEQWVAQRGAVRMESECGEENRVGQDAHRACGYQRRPDGFWSKKLVRKEAD